MPSRPKAPPQAPAEPSPQRGRPRSEASRQATLNAVIEILRDGGHSSLSIEGIAARAGVGKQTLYRWWPSRGAIILEALVEYARALPLPDTGDLAKDLEGWLLPGLEELRSHSGPALRSLMAEAQNDPEFLEAFRSSFIAERREVILEMLRRGVKRGEVSKRVDLNLLVDLLYGAMWYRNLIQHAPLNAAFGRALIKSVCQAARADLPA